MGTPVSSRTISSHLSHLVNHCLHVREFPDIMKLADASSMYKKHDNLKKDNYRSVGVLPSLSKNLRESHGSQLSNFFDKISLLCFQLLEKDIAVNQLFLICSNILKSHWIMANMLHAEAWTSARLLIVFPIA